MALESGNFVGDLVETNPSNLDGKAQGDDHLRLVKKVLKNTFPNQKRAFGNVVLLSTPRTLVKEDNNTVFIVSGSLTLPLDPAATLGTPWSVKIIATSGNVTIDPNASETINGASTFIVANGSQSDVLNSGTAFYAQQAIPAGIITMWSGAIVDIPPGWKLCDGTNGTPDLRDRFIIGAGSNYAVSASGGSKDAVVVAHTHEATVTDPGHGHGYSTVQLIGGSQAGLTAFSNYGITGRTTDANTTGISVENAETGVSGVNANLPPYYALAYIQKA